MAQNFSSIPVHAFYTVLPQLISRVIHDNHDTEAIVRGILQRVLSKFPAQAMWPMAWLRLSKVNERKKIGDSIFNEAEKTLMKHTNKTYYKILVASKSLLAYLHELAIYKPKDAKLRTINVKPWKGEISLSEFIPPIQAALSVSLSTGDSCRPRELFPRQVPRMRCISSHVSVMSSKARPKRIKAYVVTAGTNASSLSDRHDTDIGEMHFLVKQEAKGDLRKDARVQDLNNVVNRLMQSSTCNGQARYYRRLRLRTFEVTCLSEDTGLLEWVPNTEAMRRLIVSSYNPQASPYSTKRRGHRIANFGNGQLKNNYEQKCQKIFFETGNLQKAAYMFQELMLKPYPPLFYWWFVSHFQDPHSWYEARTRFTTSAAAWSAVGHVIGLGDRHSENILIDTTTGECVHVDFDWYVRNLQQVCVISLPATLYLTTLICLVYSIFDKGLSLPKPETIPFRMTQNMVDAFGPTGVDGVYKTCLKNAMGVLRDNHETLLSVLEPFVKDPIIDWKRHRSQQKSSRESTIAQDKLTQDAKRSIKVIDERLRGIYNLRNPNLKKIKRTDGLGDPDDDLTHLVPLSVEGQVHKMIAEATSNENLVQIYVGWMPWI
jgi:serine/threonine-protein kinase ATR